MDSAFAPPERADEQELQEAIRKAAVDPIVTALLRVADVAAIVLNQQRQIVALNDVAMQRLGRGTSVELLGMRPGEVLNCRVAPDAPGGCGTGANCQACGIVCSILQAQQGETPVERECYLDVDPIREGAVVEVLVRALSVPVAGHTFTFMTVRDISDQKRRQVLERLFLHDVRNTLSGLVGWANHLKTQASGEVAEAAERIRSLVERLDREVRYQHDLVQAESGKLAPEVEPVRAKEVLEDCRSFFEKNLHASQRIFVTEPIADDVEIETDPRLLVRVLTNMLRNAFEATASSGSIRLWCVAEADSCTFFVHNQGHMPDPVAAQVFRRSFSTKAEAGRGLGTYSMRLFGERYLKGKVSFTSNQKEGTVFWIRIPRRFPREDNAL